LGKGVWGAWGLNSETIRMPLMIHGSVLLGYAFSVGGCFPRCTLEYLPTYVACRDANICIIREILRVSALKLSADVHSHLHCKYFSMVVITLLHFLLLFIRGEVNNCSRDPQRSAYPKSGIPKHTFHARSLRERREGRCRASHTFHVLVVVSMLTS